jgi:hypothetical protein
MWPFRIGQPELACRGRASQRIRSLSPTANRKA